MSRGQRRTTFLSRSPREGGANFNLSHRLLRATWQLCWLLLASWTPPQFHPWRRMLLAGFGAKMARRSDVRGSATVWYPPNLTMGYRTILAERVNCYNMAVVSIEEGAIVSQGAHLCCGSHDIGSESFDLLVSPISIGRNSWVAGEAFVGPGVIVGEGAVLGARAVAFKNLEPWTNGDKRLSVVTVCYNNLAGLRSTMESISWRFPDTFEWIVIDGNSTDDTKYFLQSLQNENMIFVSEPDDGIFDAMNKGIALSTAEFIIFMNAGDGFADPATMDRLIEFLESHQADLIYGDTLEFDQTVYRTAAVAAGYDRNYRLTADWAFTARALKAPGIRVARFPGPISRFMRGGISQSQVRRAEIDSENLQISRLELGLWPEISKPRSNLVPEIVRSISIWTFKMSVAVIILTFNEELHVARAIRSVQSFASEIHIVDSYSTDATVMLSTALGANVVQHTFKNQADQFQWALDSIQISASWILRLDADEVIENDLADEILGCLPHVGEDVVGVTFNRKHIFLGRWIRYGGRFPLTMVRLFRRGHGRMEQRWMDEHIIVEGGKIVEFNGGFRDENLNNISYFVTKHNGYATREALETLNSRLNFLPARGGITTATSSRFTARKRFIKDKLYLSLPFGVRPLLYFFYRYFLQLGFLDGREGLIYHTLQGFWYRFLVDSKVEEFRRSIKDTDDPQTPEELLLRILHIIGGTNRADGGPIEGLIRQEAATREFLGSPVREIASLDSPDAPWLKDFPIKVNALGLRADDLPYLPKILRKYGYSPAMQPWLESNIDRFEVAIVHGLWNFSSYAASRVLPTGNIPYYVFTHGMLDPWFTLGRPHKQIIKQLSWTFNEGPLLRYAKSVLFTCEEESRQAAGNFLGHAFKGKVVDYGTARPPKFDESITRLIFEQLPSLKERPYILFLSRLHRKKGCDILIEGFAKIASTRPDLQLVIAGPGESELVSGLKGRARKLGLIDQIHFPGPVYDALKWSALYNADAFVLPSHQENFGIAVAEALGCGIPVLISDKVNIWREIDAANAGLVGPDTVGGVEQMLRKWLSLSDLERFTMKSAATNLFSERFDVSMTAPALLSMISSEIGIAGGLRPRPGGGDWKMDFGRQIRRVQSSVNIICGRLGFRLERLRPVRDPLTLLSLKAQENGVLTILDIGANTGQFGAAIRAAGWRGKLISFEPLSAAHSLLTLRAGKDDKWNVAPKMAIGSTTGSAQLNISLNSVSSSFLQVNNKCLAAAPAAEFHSVETVKVMTLDDAMDPYDAGPYALKLDTQGFEIEVLQGASRILDDVRVVSIEMSLVPLYEGGAGFIELYNYLTGAGFRAIALTEGFSDHQRNEMLQVEGIFVRSD
eukprot:gene19691-25611_t